MQYIMQLQYNQSTVIASLCISIRYHSDWAKRPENASLTIVWKGVFPWEFPYRQGQCSGGMYQGEFSSKDKEHVR